jgi:predicted DNA-binding protein
LYYSNFNVSKRRWWKLTDQPVSIRLSETLIDRLNKHLALLAAAGRPRSRSAVIKEALESYLDGFDTELGEQALSNIQNIIASKI